MLPAVFPTEIDGSSLRLGDNGSRVYEISSSAMVYNSSSRPPLPGERFLLIGDGKKVEVQCFGSSDLLLHYATDARMTLINIAVIPGLSFNLMYFSCVQEECRFVLDFTGTSMCNGKIYFAKFFTGSYTQATRVNTVAEQTATIKQTRPPARIAALMRRRRSHRMDANDFHVLFFHANAAPTREIGK